MINGLDGQRMLIALLIGIAILIILVLKTKVQAFLALIVTYSYRRNNRRDASSYRDD